MLSLRMAGVHSEYSANINRIKYPLIAGRVKLWDTGTLQKQVPRYLLQCTCRAIKDQAAVYRPNTASRGINAGRNIGSVAEAFLSMPNRKVGAVPEHPVCDAPVGAKGRRTQQMPSGCNRSQAQRKERKTFINNYLCKLQE